MNRLKLSISAAVAVTIAVTVSAVAMTTTEAIKQRQKEMDGVRQSMMTLAAIAKKEQPFDATVVKASAGLFSGGAFSICSSISRAREM